MVQRTFLPGEISIKDLYSDEFATWLREFMNTGALPLGPAHLLSRPNSYMVAPYTNGAHVVISNEKGEVNTFLNACPHRRKILFTIPKADAWHLTAFTGMIQGHIYCGGHGLSFTSDGEPTEHSSGCNGMTKAGITKNLGGILWVGSEVELKRVEEIFSLPLMRKHGITTFIPEGYRLHSIKIDNAKYHPVTAIETFGDIGHILAAFHDTTLARIADVSSLEIDTSASTNSVSLQVVAWKSECDPKRTSIEWFRLHEEGEKHQKESPDIVGPRRIAWWQDSVSGLTGEDYPGVHVDSRFIPHPSGFGTINVIAFYFHEDILNFRDASNDTDKDGDIVHWAMKAYLKLACEDGELCEEIDQGNLNLLRHGLGDEVHGMYETHLEGVSYQYVKWLAQCWKEHKATR